MKKQFILYYKIIFNKQNKQIAVIEIGCGTSVPTIRNMTNHFSKIKNCNCIRINPNDLKGPKNIINIKKGGLEAIKEIDEIM